MLLSGDLLSMARMQASTQDKSLARILADVDRLNLHRNLVDLETHGYTVLPGVLQANEIDAAKGAIEARVARTLDETLEGQHYLPYLLYDAPVFTDILMKAEPLTLITYLLGESCLLSSMGCHLRNRVVIRYRCIPITVMVCRHLFRCILRSQM